MTNPVDTYLNAALAGDKSSLNALIRALRPQVEKQLLRYSFTEEDRRDLVQATLMQVVRRLGSFRGDSSFSTWLFRVTANEALMMLRSQKRHRSRLALGLELDELAELRSASDGGEGNGDSDSMVADAERDALVRDALAELPDGYRDVVFAHYHLDLGLQEIADKFAMTESAVRSRLHRARSRLRTLLQESNATAYIGAAA